MAKYKKEAQEALDSGKINEDQAARWDEIVKAIEDDAKVPPVDMGEAMEKIKNRVKKQKASSPLYDHPRSKKKD